MAFCPRCGTDNPPAQAVCSACGSPLQAAAPAAPAAPAADAHKTMLGMGATAPPASGVSPTWPDGPPGQPGQPGAGSTPAAATPPTWPGEDPTGQFQGSATGNPLHKTMLGMPAPGGSPPAQQEPAQAQPQPQGGLQRTMLGIAPMPAPASAPAAPASPPQGGAAGSPAAVQQKTMLGIAPQQPGQWPPAAPPSAQPAPPAAAAPPAAPPSAQPASTPLASQQKTMLGIAHPGIAPLDPTSRKPEAAPKWSPAAPAAPEWNPAAPAAGQAGAAPTREELSVLQGHKPRRLPLVAVLAIGGFVLLLAGVAVVALLWKSSGPLSAKVTLDQHSREQLELGCPQCPDGTQAALGKASATFKSGHAVVPVEHPLVMGDNDLQIGLTKPGEERTTTVELTVPVDYRVRGDLAPLSGSPPQLRVDVQAQKGSKVSVEGKPLELAPDGSAHYDVDVTKELSGGAASVQPLERRVAYSVTPPGADKPDQGEIKFQLGIVPLVIDAPGPRIVTDAQTFMLAGHTVKGGTVRIGDRPIKVDAQGSFAQLMNVSAVGQTTINVRASAKDRAPRLFPLHVKRVTSLHDEALQFRKTATQSYTDISSDIDSKKGRAVALSGKVVESRVDHHQSFVLFDVSGGCRHSPCLARLVYGQSAHLGKGDRITAYGHVTHAVDGPRQGNTIPEVAVEFYLKGSPP
jgi:hypothetical protein